MLIRSFLPGLLLVAVAGMASGCSSGQDRVFLLGLDGADPDVIDRLMAEGKLPHFARLRQEGAYARLESAPPLLSPILWTTIATGKPPEQHRIAHFVAYDNATKEQLPVTSRMRGVEALWTIATQSDRSVSVIGWWATWPAEAVHGTIVTDHLCYHFLFPEALGERNDPATGVTHPPELLASIAPLVRKPGDLTLEEISPFVTVSAEEARRPFSFDDDLGHFKWALSAAKTYESIGERLWSTDRPDLMMLYIEGIDTASHLYGHLYRATDLSGELKEQQARYGVAVERMYEHADSMIGRILDALDRRTTLIVLSDHGFRLGDLPDDPSRTRDMRRVSEAYHEPQGILYLYGNRVKLSTRLDKPTLLDVAPTVLSLLGIAPGEDMPGRTLVEGLRDVAEPARVATWERGGRRERGPAEAARDSEIDDEILRKLESLGYTGASSPAGDRNLAAMLFAQGRYEEAARSYAALLAYSPEDGALHASLAGALGALGRYDEALDHLTRALALDPLSAEAWHNRAVVRERLGDSAAATSDYREALRYNPGYAPSREALARLGAPPDLTPLSPSQERARAIAARGATAAKSGDYEGAMRLLDEAEAAAPDFALVQQYRSNVAYLMGDRARAIAALRRGLELEPGNALFRENLKRLLAKGAEKP